MKKQIACFVSIVVLATTLSAFAASSGKIGIVDVRAVQVKIALG